MNADWRSRYELCVDLARKAGDLALGYFEEPPAVEYKSDSSPVTRADREAEELIRAGIAKHFPDDGVLGEEFGDTPGTSGFRWITDPIDGTKSFVRGVPLWGTLLGLELNGDPIAGAAYAPGIGQMYRALRGDGAYRNDKRIRVTDVSTLADAHLSYSSFKWFQEYGREAAFAELVAGTARQRGYGDFYGFCLVAQGAMDIMIDHGVHPWDVAPLLVLVEEAGGQFSDWSGRRTIRSPDVAATNGRLHETVLRILAGADTPRSGPAA